jgi:Amt family ammonium transporter
VASVLLARLTRRPVLMSATVNASLCGLVSVTAGAAYMTMPWAALTGMVGGVLCLYGAEWLQRFRLDDMVDATAVHGLGGVWGTLAVGLFYRGDPFDPARVQVQVLGILVAFLWTFPASWLLFKLLDRALGLRASTLHEQRGLDYTEHDELGYPEFQRTVSHGGVSE